MFVLCGTQTDTEDNEHFLGKCLGPAVSCLNSVV